MGTGSIFENIKNINIKMENELKLKLDLQQANMRGDQTNN